MKQWATRLIAVAVLLAVCFWLWQAFFPRPEKVIRGRVMKVAKLISFSPNEGSLSMMSKVSSALDYFSTDIQCFVETPDIPDAGDWNINGREDLRNNLIGSRSLVGSLRVEFIDV